MLSGGGRSALVQTFKFYFMFRNLLRNHKWKTKGWKTMREQMLLLENKEMENKNGTQKTLPFYVRSCQPWSSR